MWCISQIQYGRIDIEEPRRRWGFDPLDAFAKTIEKCANLEGDDNHEEGNRTHLGGYVLGKYDWCGDGDGTY